MREVASMDYRFLERARGRIQTMKEMRIGEYGRSRMEMGLKVVVCSACVSFAPKNQAGGR